MEPKKMNGTSKAEERARGVQIIKPFLYGNVAKFFGRRIEDRHTHQWTVYLRAYDDMSVYVKDVHFYLHESYEDSIRVCNTPPYEVTETGWGEFEVKIEIFFRDSNEMPMTFYHNLKLFDRHEDGSLNLGTDPVHFEFYKEMVFVDPTVELLRLLSLPELHDDYEEEEKIFTHLQRILEAQEKVEDEITGMRAKWAEMKNEIVMLKWAMRGGNGSRSLVRDVATTETEPVEKIQE